MHLISSAVIIHLESDENHDVFREDKQSGDNLTHCLNLNSVVLIFELTHEISALFCLRRHESNEQAQP